MPNTLAHIGAQGPASRLVLPGADLKWVFLGCIVPDLGWILQRFVWALPVVEVSPYDLRLYTAAQTSLFMCLILSAGLAAFSRFAGRVFLILALNAVLHLLLDATETKWANGVHLLAPFSWELVNFGLYWPEDAPTLALTGLGVVFFVYAWWRLPEPPSDLVRPRGRRAALAALALLAYVLLPPAFMPALRAADSHFVGTLMARDERPGRPVEFDRIRYVDDGGPGGGALVVWTGERLAATGLTPEGTTKVSVRGRFVDETTVEILELRTHPPGQRDLASVAGLLLVLAWWLRSLHRPLRAAWRGRRTAPAAR